MEMGLSYQGVVEHYLGSPEKFTRPKSIRGLMEVSHFHLFAMGIFLVSLMHLLLFVPVNGLLKVVLIVAAFTSAFLDEASGWLIVFVSPLFAYMKIASFVILQLSLITTIALSAWSVAMSKRNAYADSAQRPRPS
jgi:magnesium-transporting ATPase (P-type)